MARCKSFFRTPYGDRRCDLRTGHSGAHIRNDGCGRPEYYWLTEPTQTSPAANAGEQEITDTGATHT